MNLKIGLLISHCINLFIILITIISSCQAVDNFVNTTNGIIKVLFSDINRLTYIIEESQFWTFY